MRPGIAEEAENGAAVEGGVEQFRILDPYRSFTLSLLSYKDVFTVICGALLFLETYTLSDIEV